MTDNPEAARSFVVEAQRAADWARENPDQAKEILAKILERRGENPELAQFWSGFGLRPGASAIARDIEFWIGPKKVFGPLRESIVQATANQDEDWKRRSTKSAQYRRPDRTRKVWPRTVS